jgi:hypothetical protein
LEYKADVERAMLSERQFASAFLRAVDSLSAGRQDETHAVRWIACGGGHVSRGTDGGQRWKRFYVAVQVMRSGVRVDSHFGLGVPGWDVKVVRSIRKNRGAFWLKAAKDLDSVRGGESNLFSVVRHVELYAALTVAEPACEGAIPDVHAGLAVHGYLEEHLQAQLGALYRIGVLP